MVKIDPIKTCWIIAILLSATASASIDYAGSYRGDGDLEWDYDAGICKSRGLLQGESALGHTASMEWDDYKENITVDSDRGSIQVKTLEFSENIQNAEGLRGAVQFGRSFKDTEEKEQDEENIYTTTTRHFTSGIRTNMTGKSGAFKLRIMVPDKDRKPLWSQVSYEGKDFEIINSLRLSGLETWTTTESILDATENKTE